MKNLNKNSFISTSRALIAVTVVFSIFSTFSGSIINTASATGNFEVSVVETGGRIKCENMPPFSSTGSRYFTYTISVKNNTNKTYKINKAAFHSHTAGCGFYDGSPAGGGWEVISGEQIYAPGQNGTLVLRYDVNSQSCGRVQYDAGYRAVDGSTGGNVFIGNVINYGVDCDPPPSPTLSCSLSTNPSSGTSPLNDVDLTANVSGTAKGNIVYSFDCTNNGTWDYTSSATSANPYTKSDLCDYATAGTYTIKAKVTRNGVTATCNDTIVVNSAPNVSCAISANPTSILDGQSSTLNWTSSNATSCTASDAWSNSKPLSGTKSVSPKHNSTYTLTCSGPGGSATCSASVAVTSNPAPTCSISANPTSILIGQSSLLTWTSSNTTTCVASNAWSGTKSISGIESVSPSNDSTYSLTCSGPGGSVTCSTSVDVNSNPAPNCSIDANPTTISKNEHSTLDWTSNNANYCVASNDWSGTKSISGTQSVSPDYDSTYTLTCYNSSASASCTTHVYVEEDENADLEINKLVRNITDGNSFTNSVHAEYNDELEFSLEVHSDGNGTAEDVRVWDNLPSYLTYISGSTTVDGSYRGDGVTTGGISIGDMYSGETNTIKFKVRVSSQYNNDNEITLTNYGYADADNTDYVYDTAQIILEGEEYGEANLRINKLVRNITNSTGFYDSVNAKPGDEVEFSIEVSSIGSKAANNVRVWDTLPLGLNYISGSTTINGSYFSDGVVNNGIYIGTINSGVSKEIRFKAKVIGVSTGTSNVVTIDVGSQNVQITGNISVSKMGRNITQNQTVWSYSVPSYYGDTIEISIQLTNNSGSTVNGVTIKEILPSSLSLISGSTSIDGNSTSANIVSGINLGTMTNGQVKTVKFRVTVVGGTSYIVSGVLNNIAYANADNISQIYDQASVVISGESGEVLGASVVTGMGLTPFLMIPTIMSLIITFFIYCRTREEKILDYLNQKKGSRLLKLLIKTYFKIKLRFKLANVRFKQVYL